MMTDLRSKFVGALLGTAVGDALGAPVEGWTFKEVQSIHLGGMRWPMRSGRYTDDTEMMIGVAESLIRRKGFEGEDMARTFIQNYDPARGYGPGTEKAVQRLRAGAHWSEASKAVFGGAGSYGNGAAMRIAPVGLFYYDDLNLLRMVAYQASQITHAHELGKEGAALQAVAVAFAVRGERIGMVDALKGFVHHEVYKTKLQRLEALLATAANGEAIIAELGTGEAAFESVPTAIYAFLRFASFEASVTYAVSLGGDSDTIGAMTGAISGAYYGEEAIPVEWLERLEAGAKGRRYITRLAEELYSSKELLSV
jgi:poly(ADP-ribose) glycohydrolase ARH3